MDRRKLESAALFLTIFGALLILPPLAVVFQLKWRFLGIPAEVIYLFVCWAAMIVGAYWMSRRLPREPDAETPSEDEG